VVRLASLTLATLLLLASAMGSAAADVTVRLIYHGARDKPVVALTFDDGYSATNCASILDILERRHVAATFFPYAWAVRGAPAFWRRVARDGFPIANHTTSHPDMTTLTLPDATKQITQAEQMIEKVTGRPMIKVFRPPYGAWNKTVIEAARDAGYPTVLLWDVDSRDWGSSSASAVLRAASRGHAGSVVLMHCGPSVTPTILEAVIDGYQKRGFGFVAVPQLLSGKVPATAFPAPAAEPPPPPPVVVDPETKPISLMSIALAHRWTDWAI
jgi:peptidoglycan-N-acetylglucosamine deacetylase